MPDDDPGMNLYEILARGRDRGRSVLKMPDKPRIRATLEPRQRPMPSPGEFWPRRTAASSPPPKPAPVPDSPPPPSAENAQTLRDTHASVMEVMPPNVEMPSLDNVAPTSNTERSTLAAGEFVLDINTGLLLFTIALSLACVSYVLGYRSGARESSGNSRVLNATLLPSESRPEQLPPPKPSDWALVLKYYNMDHHNEPTREAILAMARTVETDLRRNNPAHGFRTSVFANTERNTYALAITGFRDENDANLHALRAFLANYPGPPGEKNPRPYATPTLERVEAIGRLVGS